MQNIQLQYFDLNSKTFIPVYPNGVGNTVSICDEADISGEGVSSAVPNYSQATLYLIGADEVVVTISLSPDGGDTWVAMSDTVIIAMGGASEMVEIKKQATDIKLVGTTDANVTAMLRCVVVA